MQLKTFFVQDKFGNAMPGALCYVYEHGTTTLVTTLRDAHGLPLANPVTADSAGAVQVAAPDGMYSVRTLSGVYDRTVSMQFVDNGPAVELLRELREHGVPTFQHAVLSFDNLSEAYASVEKFYEGQVVEVMTDEDQGWVRSRRKFIGGVLVPLLLMDYERSSALAATNGADRVGFEGGTVSDRLSHFNILTRSVLTPMSVAGLGTVEEGFTDSAANSAMWEILRQEAEAGKREVWIPAGTYLLDPDTRLDADNTTWNFHAGALLKMRDATVTRQNFLVYASPKNQVVRGLRFDANRANHAATTFGVDNCGVIVVDAENCDFEGVKIISSPAKGFAVVSSNGGLTSNLSVRNVSGGNCDRQAVIFDGNNSTGRFKMITLGAVRIWATSHAGVAINDGAHDIIATDIVCDVQNSVWDAIAIRDSHDIQLNNARGLRGRNGIGLWSLDGRCRNIQLNNVSGENNQQNGVLITGAENVTGSIVSGRNNAAAGVNIGRIPSGYNSKNIHIETVVGVDDRVSHSQQYGLLVTAADNVTVGSVRASGNTDRDVSILRASTTNISVPVRQIVETSTGTVTNASQASVIMTFPTQFEDGELVVESLTVHVSSKSRGLSVGHVVALTPWSLEVQVFNFGVAPMSGTLKAVVSRKA